MVSAPLNASPTPPPCVEIANNCHQMSFICTDQNPSIHEYAIKNCAITCGLCKEYVGKVLFSMIFSSLQNGEEVYIQI